MPNIPFPLRGGDFKDFAIRDCEIALKRKFWAVVEKNLRAVIDNDPTSQTHRIYFAGGTLCIDIKDHLYMLGINGKGSITSIIHNPSSKKVYLPDFITQLVMGIYLQERGGTGYFLNNHKDIAWV